MQNEILKTKLKQMPTLAGCYIWKDFSGDILYIGKAVNLKNRVNSYFNNYSRLDPKIKLMVDQIADVEVHTVDSEVEALILETNLIKKYRPKYNKLMKDDKNYSYVMIDWYRDYPSVKIVRDQDDPRAEYYGPYPSRFPIFKVLRRLRKVYPYCEHIPSFLNNPLLARRESLSKPCFDTHIGLCSGVCSDLITKEEHRKNITGIRRFFQGKKIDMIEELKKDMSVYAKAMNFERAAGLRDRIQDLEYVTQRIKIDRDMDEHKLEQMKAELSRRTLHELADNLDMFKLNPDKPDFKIECFDISNIQGTNAVASMVVFVGGKPAKQLYRKFRIKTKYTPDDFAMMREVLTRRFKRYLNSLEDDIDREKSDDSFNILPDLLIVDGGKGQLSAAFDVFYELQLPDVLPFVGLAKREEEIFYIKDVEMLLKHPVKVKNIPEFGRILLPRRSEALYLIQRIRDEAHRFAITFHRSLRGKASTKSVLDDIKGVGKALKKKLLDAFGSIEGIQKASQKDLLTVIRNKETVKNIKNRL